MYKLFLLSAVASGAAGLQLAPKSVESGDSALVQMDQPDHNQGILNELDNEVSQQPHGALLQWMNYQPLTVFVGMVVAKQIINRALPIRKELRKALQQLLDDLTALMWVAVFCLPVSVLAFGSVQVMCKVFQMLVGKKSRLKHLSSKADLTYTFCELAYYIYVLYLWMARIAFFHWK